VALLSLRGLQESLAKDAKGAKKKFSYPILLCFLGALGVLGERK
jgi:hypothetical protein